MSGESWGVGAILLDKYRVEAVLGEGGMGIVVAARHLSLEERVAIKFLLPDAMANPTVVARFLQEARAAVRIRSEHVARVFDVGKLESGEPYMIMEHLSGSDLAHQIEARGPLPLGQSIECVVQACEALAEAHVLGIIHRDLKPANLFLTQRADGSSLVKVLDFGISKATLAGGDAASAVSLTQTSTAIGTPLYMSPEQMRSARQADVRSDVWSLGATLYELLAGQPPFYGESLTEVCASILTDEPPPLRARRSDLPPAVEAIVYRCLEKSPDRRFQNMGELALALAACEPEVMPLARRVAGIVGIRPSALPPSLSAPGSLPGAASASVGLVAALPAPVVSSPGLPGSVVPPTLASSSSLGHTAGAPQTVDLPAPAPARPLWVVPVAAVGVLGLAAGAWALTRPPAVAPAALAASVAPTTTAPPVVPVPPPSARPDPVTESPPPPAPTASSARAPGSIVALPPHKTSPTSPPTPTPTTAPTPRAPAPNSKGPDIGY